MGVLVGRVSFLYVLYARMLFVLGEESKLVGELQLALPPTASSHDLSAKELVCRTIKILKTASVGARCWRFDCNGQQPAGASFAARRC